ncbi:MAG TPA: hypothetical protein VHM19_22085, partial [Polyangiales bacterium]|nr:hypothetical protein [Polyangiales bacterium]
MAEVVAERMSDSISSTSVLPSDADEGVTEAAIADRMNEQLAQAMRPICVGLALFYALISIWYVHELTVEAAAATPDPSLLVDLGLFSIHLVAGAMKPISTGLFSFALLAAAFWFERNELPPKLAHPVASAISVAIIANCLLLIVSVGEARQTTNLMIAQIGFGCLLFSTRWFSLLSAISIGGWLLVVGPRRAEADWYHFGLALTQAALFGLLVITV